LTGAGRLPYGKRVDRVIDYIRAHLADELTLGGLAAVATFSPFHFHRVFKASTGETLFEFIPRLRIERAASALIAHPRQSVLEVALDHGFASAATFARAFRARFGMSASQWRGGGAGAAPGAGARGSCAMAIQANKSARGAKRAGAWRRTLVARRTR
jgi:AraC family transcriptional regulator